MKKFWEKYKVLILVLVGIAALITLSVITENANKVEEVASTDLIEWAEKVQTEEKVLTVIALSYCSHCAEYKPVINEIASEYNIPLYWFEIDEMNSTDSEILTGTVDFSEYKGSSPYTAITYGGQVLDQTVGYANKDAVLEFLNANDLAK